MRGVGSASDQDDMNARSSAESLLPKSAASLAMSLGSMSLLYSFSVWQKSIQPRHCHDSLRTEVGGANSGGTEPENPLFAAYDALMDFVQERGIELEGDLFDSVLSLYGGNLSEKVNTETSVKVRSFEELKVVAVFRGEEENQ